MGRDAEEAKAVMSKKKDPKPRRVWVSTGVRMLNFSATGSMSRGYKGGGYYLIVGKSSSGKTVLALAVFAEAANDPDFDDYEFIYDAPEEGALMDREKFYGRKAASRIKAPRYDKSGNEIHSATLEEFYFNVDTHLKKGPCIYVLDSHDALGSMAQLELFKKNKSIFDRIEKGKKASDGKDLKFKQAYGDGKAAVNSQTLRLMFRRLVKTKSILIIICQSRDNIGPDAMFNPETRAGGRALKFYANFEIWFSVKERIKRKINGRYRQIGIQALAKVKKNRLSGKEWEAQFPIYWTFGIDDTGSMVDFLCQEGYWKKKGKKTDEGKILAQDFEFEGSREELIKHIEGEGLEKALRRICRKVGEEIIEKCQVTRKARYE